MLSPIPSNIIYQLKYPFKLWMYELIDQWVMREKVQRKQKKILIYRLDLIGDYLMCRPFFKTLKDDPKYADYQFTFAGNIACKSLAEWLDGEIFDDFVWIDRARFINSIGYRFRILKQVHDSGFEMVIYPSHTRQYWLESVVRVSGASIRITCEPIGKYMNSWELNMTQGRYSNIVSTGNGSLFEFFRNRNFFSSLSGLALSIESLQTNLPHLELDFSFPQTGFIVLAPGASTENRRWPIAKFAALVEEICERGRVEIVVIGSSGEAVLGDKLQAVLHGIKINNLAGKLSLPQSIVLLSKAKMLISNESSPVHMAATTGTPTLCISQGNHFGRWNPYPDSIAPWIKTVYPKWFENQSPEDLAERFHDGSNEDISQITVEEILLEMKGL